MRSVDDHADPVHLAHDLTTERADAVMQRRKAGVAARVGDSVVTRMRELLDQREAIRRTHSHVAHAESPILTQDADRFSELMCALDAHQTGDATRCVRSSNIAGRVGKDKVVRIGVDHLTSDVDLLQRVANTVRRRREVGRHVIARRAWTIGVNAPEDRARPPRAQPRDVHVLDAMLSQVHRRQIEGMPFADRNRRIDVRVDLRR